MTVLRRPCVQVTALGLATPVPLYCARILCCCGLSCFSPSRLCGSLTDARRNCKRPLWPLLLLSSNLAPHMALSLFMASLFSHMAQRGKAPGKALKQPASPLLVLSPGNSPPGFGKSCREIDGPHRPRPAKGSRIPRLVPIHHVLNSHSWGQRFSLYTRTERGEVRSPGKDSLLENALSLRQSSFRNATLCTLPSFLLPESIGWIGNKGMRRGCGWGVQPGARLEDVVFS